MIEIRNDGAEPEMVELFRLDDTPYMVPANPSMGLGLRYLADVRKCGTEVAAAGLLENLIGSEGFAALCSYPGITNEQLESVMDAASKLVLGSLEKVDQGKSVSES